MNIAHTLAEIRTKFEWGHDLLREEVASLFAYIEILEETAKLDRVHINDLENR